VVQDADRLDAIGAIGIARTFTFGGAKNRPLYNPDKPLMTEVADLEGEAYSEAQANIPPTYDHFYEKLLRLQGMMKTSAGKARAEKRHIFMETFLEQMRAEISGKD